MTPLSTMGGTTDYWALGLGKLFGWSERWLIALCMILRTLVL